MVSLCVPGSVYVHVPVCGMPLTNLVSLACLPMSQKVQNVNFLKIQNFKNIIDRCIIYSLWVTPVQVHNCAKYEGSKFNHVDRRAK